MIHAHAISNEQNGVCGRWTPLDAVVILLLCVSGRVKSAATSRLWFQLLNQLETCPHTPNNWLNAEVWHCSGSKKEWEKHTEFRLNSLVV